MDDSHVMATASDHSADRVHVIASSMALVTVRGIAAYLSLFVTSAQRREMT
ncbi:hypothetical protein ACFXG4_43420 [Nocardia sp. NPDC059246]|uniref:hypothetical protein n=1 Tax=unclassified Nocardia TaxID=2637762 RepID=UPI0036816C5F